jgi:hypothetical protein
MLQKYAGREEWVSNFDHFKVLMFWHLPAVTEKKNIN